MRGAAKWGLEKTRWDGPLLEAVCPACEHMEDPGSGDSRAQQVPGVREYHWTRGEVSPRKGHPERVVVQQVVSSLSPG